MLKKDLAINVWAIIFFALLIGLSFSLQAEEQDLPEVEGLVEYEDAKVDIAEIRPGTDWKKYKTIYLSRLRVTAEAIDATPAHQSGRRSPGESWVLRDKDVQVLVDIYDEVMRDELGKRGGFEFVDEAQVDTLIVVVGIIDIYLTAPIEDTRRTSVGRGSVYTESGGALSMGAVLADGKTGLIIATATDTRYATRGFWRENTRIGNIADARQIFRAWAKNFRKRLTGFQSGKITPP